MYAEPLEYLVATEAWQFNAIHKLNYKTFVEEIPQHGENSDRMLIDRFHHENTYIICLRGSQLSGMVAVRDKRPFSLDQKLQNVDSYLPAERSVCEIRLLAIEKEQRSGIVFRGLMRALYELCRSRNYDIAVISGTVRQLKLYKSLGFIPFGPLVGSAEASFQPMYITLKAASPRILRFALDARRTVVNLLPGPVEISNPVRRRFGKSPVSHRSESFVENFQKTKIRLCQFVQANHVDILMGSGTLANDTIAAQLSLVSAPGAILSNGEFGERLIDHASRFGLSFDVIETDWGNSFDLKQIRQRIQCNPPARWLWAVHCETSTGVLNDLSALKRISAAHDLLLCVDCISSIGTLPVDLTGVHFASGVSGKGIGAFPGLALVFHDRELTTTSPCLPRYLDLGCYTAGDGIPFTLSSNLLDALHAALECHSADSRYAEIEKLSAWLRAELTEAGLRIVGIDGPLSPAVTTIALPPDVSSTSLGRRLEEAGFLLSYMSRYLLDRNWMQICLMSNVSPADLRALISHLHSLIFSRRREGSLRARPPFETDTSQMVSADRVSPDHLRS